MNAAIDRSDYQSKYYREHRDELSRKRKEKYYSDPEARQRSLDRAKKRREKKKKEQEALRKAGKLPERKVPNRKPLYVNIDGNKVLVHRVCVLAERIGRSVDSINKWIGAGVMPQTPFRTNGGDRLYTNSMIMVVKMAVQSRGIVGNDKSIYDDIVSGWEEFGVRLDA